MKIGVLLAARTSSRRLPHKVLRRVQDRTLLEHIVDRLGRARTPELIAVCTSVLPSDDIIADLAELNGWTLFRGSADDVLERFYEAARAFELDLVVRATADNLFLCTEHIDWMIDQHLALGVEWATVDGLPWGMKCETISFAALERAYRHAEDTSMSEYLTWFFDQPEYFRTVHLQATEAYQRPEYRVTIDTVADLQAMREICRRIGAPASRIGTAEIIDLLDRSPGLVAMNAEVPDRFGDLSIRSRVNTRLRAAPFVDEKPSRVPEEVTAPPELPTMIVAEIGQNHNGSVDFARSLIDIASLPVIDQFTQERLHGVNAVKLTKRDLEEELTSDAAMRPYESPHAFGQTYGEHRKALELSYEQHRDLGEYAHERGLLFIETLCSPKCVRLCDMVAIDYLKVASRDLANIPLIRELAQTRIPMILSTGMGAYEHLDRALEEIVRLHEDVSILHCISEYPARYENLGLPRIGDLMSRYPTFRIGYSDHSVGIVMPVVGVALGATIVEKHVTLSRRLKGADHAGALEPDGLWRMTRDIRNFEKARRRVPEHVRRAVTEDARMKLERSLASRRPVHPGDELSESDLMMLSPGGGLSWEERHVVLGRRVLKDIPSHTHLRVEMFESPVGGSA